jgi:hypothetical protein
MSAGEWIALCGLGFTVLVAIVAGVRHAVATAYRFGQHASRLDAVEERTKSADANAAALAVLTATVGGIDTRLSEVARDVKNLLTGRIRPGGRGDDAVK